MSSDTMSASRAPTCGNTSRTVASARQQASRAVGEERKMMSTEGKTQLKPRADKRLCAA